MLRYKASRTAFNMVFPDKRWKNVSQIAVTLHRIRPPFVHRYAVVVQDLTTQWIQSVQNKNFSPSRKPKVIYTVGIWQGLWRFFLESLNVNATQIGNEWDCWKSNTQNWGREIGSAIAVRSGLFFAIHILHWELCDPLWSNLQNVWLWARLYQYVFCKKNWLFSSSSRYHNMGPSESE